jgi:hypothetical protein
MKLARMITELQKLMDEHGPDTDVLLSGDDDRGPMSVGSVKLSVAEQDEYPKDWNMPGGFKFVEVSDW